MADKGKNEEDETCGDTKERKIIVWQSSLTSAKECILKKNYGRAFAHFLLVLKLCPSMKTAIKDDFVLSLREWTESLERQGRIEDLFKCYDQAVEFFPECEAAFNNIGAQLFRLGYTDEAALYVRRALKIDPNFLPAKENLENICSHIIERWHFRMLNDMTRNRAFRDAIDLAVAQGYKCLLDIGTGTGLLSLFAEEAGASMVYACEVSKSMFEVASEVVAANCSTREKIKLIPKLSLDIRIPEDIPECVPLVVTETFDAGLFGEHIVSTLHHAWQSLLLPANDKSPQTGGKVIPAGATVYLCPVECETIRKQNRFLYPVLLNLELDNVDLVCRTSNIEEEPYTTECLSGIRGGYTQLAEPVEALTINFSDAQQVAELHDGLRKDVNIHVKQGGKLDALALWFDLHLDKNVTITTNPKISNCWEQAIFPVLASHFVCAENNTDVRENYAVKQGDTLQIKCCLKEDCFRVTCASVSRGHSSFKPDARMCSSVRGDHLSFYLSHSELSRLNDITLNRCYLQALEMSRQVLSSPSVSVLDMCTGLSPLGLQAAQAGFHQVTMTPALEEAKNFLLHVADMNNIDRERLNFCHTKDILDSENEFDMIIADLLDSSGVFHQQRLEDLALIRLTSLQEDGLILPESITVMGMCIESEDLAKSSCVVTSEYTLGYQIGDYIKDFQTTTHLDIDLHTLAYRKLCEPFKMFYLDFNEKRCDSDLPGFLHQERELTVMLTDSGLVHAVVYWFNVQVKDNIHFTTLDPSLHWKHAGKMMKNNFLVSAGKSQMFKVLLKNSCIDIVPVR